MTAQEQMDKALERIRQLNNELDEEDRGYAEDKEFFGDARNSQSEKTEHAMYVAKIKAKIVLAYEDWKTASRPLASNVEVTGVPALSARPCGLPG